MNAMTTNLASSITKAASKQTYHTVRLLVDRERVDDAFRAYAYFRWVDDTLDGEAGSRLERTAFLERQKALLDQCYRSEAPTGAAPEEQMLIELTQHAPDPEGGLQAYLCNMMRVMEFDTRRRGRLIAQAELNEYTRWLATAVAEAMHYFIGHGRFAPRAETRYLAVTAAHIAHMLRDTYADLQAGYYNIPREVLDAYHIGPEAVQSDAYRAWVRSRVRLAREYFKAGQGYYAQVQCVRHRLAAMAYTARFAWVLDTIETEGYCLRPEYQERRSAAARLRMGWLTLQSLVHLRPSGAPPQPAVLHR
jgi:hypothetical protein